MIFRVEINKRNEVILPIVEIYLVDAECGTDAAKYGLKKVISECSYLYHDASFYVSSVTEIPGTFIGKERNKRRR